MGRVVGIDYGKKRTGLAITDPLQIIATPLSTVSTDVLLPFLKNYAQKEKIDKWIVGLPKKLNGQNSDIEPTIRRFVNTLNGVFPTHPVVLIDERFTSKIAYRSMLDGGMKKKDRQKKENIDKISAVLILQSYLNTQSDWEKTFPLPH